MTAFVNSSHAQPQNPLRHRLVLLYVKDLTILVYVTGGRKLSFYRGFVKNLLARTV
jgi:hypothetical protein